MDKIKLICIPYAGGSSIFFNSWKALLDDSIELKNIELSGRGSRVNEPLYKDIPEAVEDIYSIIKEDINDSKYAFFGHSMGSLLVFELMKKIALLGNKSPVHAFFSGRKAPHSIEYYKHKHNLPYNEFIEAVKKLGGTPDELFLDYNFKFFEPILRADFKINETYTYEPYNEKFDCDFSIFFGNKDDMKYMDMYDWEQYTIKKFNIYEFNGDHFYIYNNLPEVLHTINSTLLRY